jgi:hypothetical protein
VRRSKALVATTTIEVTLMNSYNLDFKKQMKGFLQIDLSSFSPTKRAKIDSGHRDKEATIQFKPSSSEDGLNS